LFATLDPTLRQIKLPDYGELVIADTVGFIQDLPHELVAAFRSTLQETIEADILLHVVDASSPGRAEQITEVNKVLREIGADKIPTIMVYNKIDLLPSSTARVDKDAVGQIQAVWVSAEKKIGLDGLLSSLSTCCHPEKTKHCIRLKPSQGKLRAELFSTCEVVSEAVEENGDFNIVLNIAKKHLHLLDGVD
jgi:GTP-binding protein HflX